MTLKLDEMDYARGIGIILLILVIGGMWIYNIFEDKEISEYKIIERCSNLSVEKTANCLRDEVRRFYHYEDSPDYYYAAGVGNIIISEEKTKDFDEIRRTGGDCNDYSELYKRFGEILGFPSYTLTLENEEIGHKFAVFYHKTTEDKSARYCILDLLEVNCF